MKRINKIITVSLLLASAIPAAAKTVVYDGFDTTIDYTNGILVDGTNGGEGFAPWDTTDMLSSIYGLNYSDGTYELETTGGAMVLGASGYDLADRDLAVQDVEDTTVYFSLLYHTGIDNPLHYPLVLQSSESAYQFIQLREETTGNGQLGLFLNLSGSNANAHEQWGNYVSFPSQTTHFIVGALEITSGGNDRLRIWLNPSNLSDIESLTPTWTVTEGDDFLGGSSNPVGFFTPLDGIRFVSNVVFGGYSVLRDELRFAYGDGASIRDVVSLVESPATVHYEGFSTPGDYVDEASLNAINGGTSWNGSWNTSKFCLFTDFGNVSVSCLLSDSVALAGAWGRQ